MLLLCWGVTPVCPCNWVHVETSFPGVPRWFNLVISNSCSDREVAVSFSPLLLPVACYRVFLGLHLVAVLEV